MNHQLPPLPEARIGTKFFSDGLGDVRAKDTKPYYLPKDMTAYGLQCAEAERARCLKICRVLIHEEKERRQNYAAAVVEICAERIERK